MTTHRQRNRTKARVGTAVRAAAAAALAEVVSSCPQRTVHKKHVNWGWCEDVAEGAKKRLSRWGIRSLVVCDDDELRVPWIKDLDDIYPPGHWWLYVPELGTHHDAEAPRGVMDWTRLPLFLRCVALGGNVTRIHPIPRERHQFQVDVFLARKLEARFVAEGLLPKSSLGTCVGFRQLAFSDTSSEA